MARKPRIEYEGAFYHVITRGNKRVVIFRDNGDRVRFLEKLKEYKTRYNFVLYAYTLMDNHIHLLLETRQTPLSKIMQGLLQSYTQWHNRKYRTVGHLFQGRYKAILCDKDIYLLQLVRYIHLNPIRAGIETSPSHCKWTSHRTYLKGDNKGLVDTDLVLNQFSANKRRAIRLYNKFVNEDLRGDKGEKYYEVRDQRILGDEEFYEEVIQRTGERWDRVDSILRNKTLKEIAAKIEGLTGVTAEQLRGKARDKRVVKARGLFIRASRIYTKARGIDIARFLGRKPSVLSYIEQQGTSIEFDNILTKFKW
ncbi:hypothetical protein CH333_03725 [candidate division WOR-3 bacterium JGI_Cruoil_03_44_89]|uniref:Transposase IS200-like domain-containing protein n=1 Tax=candidate division WOR-3 bacterium JGI_Cruoil_03_44_89 TaxID=1973748 RepID=A0A235BVR7_UNCW3|nr:MAG: hypothetical protein CH333_03725 [candidate division WOR-3 bacterium JGI_Cruoil_03_44_89]